MENLNGFIMKNNLVLDIKNKYKCKICSGVLVEPVTPRCLCNFCKKCLVKYLNGEDKPCPGCEKNNKESIINCSIDIRENFVVESKLNSIKCKCVFDNCDEYFELKSILEHIQKCIHCDFLCTGEINTLKELSILRNVNNEVKEKMIKLSSDMKEKVDKLEKENVELRNNYLELRNKLDGFIKNNKEVTEKLKKDNTEISKENLELRIKLKETIDTLQTENTELRNKSENNTRENKEMNIKMKENEENMKKIIESLNEEVKLLKKNKTPRKKFEERESKKNIDKESICEKQIYQYNYAFTNVSQFKEDEWHFSPPFQLSNYEFRFRIIYFNDGNIGIWIDLLPSSNDSSNEWPIKKKFIFEIIKNESQVKHVEFDFNSSSYKDHFKNVTQDCTRMRDSYIYTFDRESIFENKLILKLTLI